MGQSTANGDSDSDSEQHADVATVSERLGDQLGSSLVEFIAGSGEGSVSSWSAGQSEPSPDVAHALRITWQVFSMVADADSAGVARAWFIGMNPELADDSPAEALSEGRYDAVLAAARTYVRTG